MRVDIALPNVEVSGTVKYVGFLAQGFASLGHTVRILYSGQGPNRALIEPVFGSVPRIRYAGERTHWFSRIAIGTPILRLFTNFQPDQSVNLLGSFLGANRFRELTAETDLILYANEFAFPPLRLLQNRDSLEVMIFHEGIGSDNLPFPLRQSIVAYCRRLARFVDKSVAITTSIAEVLRTEGVNATPIYPGFVGGLAPERKEEIVLADSRWGLGRDPFRLLEFASLLPKAKFVMVGRFQNDADRNRLVRSLRETQLEQRVTLLGRVTEAELLDLYNRAKYVLRWGNDRGFPLSLVYAVSSGCIPLFASRLGGARHLAEEVSPVLAFESDLGLARVLSDFSSDEDLYQNMRKRVLAWRNRRPWSEVAAEIIDSLHR